MNPLIRILNVFSTTLPHVTKEEIVEAEKGKLKIVWHMGHQPGHCAGVRCKNTHTVIGPLSQSESIIYNEAKRRHYVLVTARRYRGTVRGCNMYFHWCDANNLPYVTVRKKRLKASVEIDLITTSRKLTDTGADLIAELFEKYGVGSGWSSRLFSDRIEKDAAPMVAGQIYEIWAAHSEAGAEPA